MILNKVDLAGVDGAATVERWIDHHFTRVRLVPAINCEVPLHLLISVGRFDETQVTHDEPNNRIVAITHNSIGDADQLAGLIAGRVAG